MERVKTRDIRRTLEEYAEKYQIPIEEVDFDIISAELVGPENGKFVLETEIELKVKTPGIITIFDCLVEIDNRPKESYAYLKVLPTFRIQLSANQLENAMERIELTSNQKQALLKRN